jgi:hypothetical protein
VTDALHVVFDETALVAAGRGNVIASRLIDGAHNVGGWFVSVPTCALVDADRTRPGIAEHIAALPAVTVIDLDLAAALAVARSSTWAPAHARYAAEPTPERPEGAFIATAVPERCKGEPVRVLDLNP